MPDEAVPTRNVKGFEKIADFSIHTKLPTNSFQYPELVPHEVHGKAPY